MAISSGIEALLLMLLGATVVFLMVRAAERAYRDKPQIWRGQAFLSGRHGADQFFTTAGARRATARSIHPSRGEPNLRTSAR